MKWLNLDWETYCDLDIKKVGAYKYAQHTSCEVILGGYSYTDGATKIWDALSDDPMPEDLREHLLDPEVLIFAFNATFERLVLKYVLEIDLPLERFRCTQVHAYSLSFTGGLADVGSQIGIEKEKLTAGKDLIKFFCQPKKPSKSKPWTRNYPMHDPVKWEKFKDYCIRDVDAEKEIGWFLDAYPMPDEEWEAWFMDQRINDRGLPLDMELVDAAIHVAEKENTKVLGEIQKITSVGNPNSKPQVKAWLNANKCAIPNMQGDTFAEWEPKSSDETKIILQLLSRIAKSSYKKYATMLLTEVSGRVHGTLQFMGASRTARWAGRLIQPQNFVRPPKGYKAEDSIKKIKGRRFRAKIMTHLAVALRGTICAPPREMFAVADLAGIEGRVLPWLCFFQEKLDKIKAGLDMYLVAAAEIYNIPYETLKDPSEERFTGKVAELALGYQGAVSALNSMAKSNGLPEFEEKNALDIVKKWRKANDPIKNFWYDCEKAAKNAVFYYKEYSAGRLKFYMDGQFLCMELPSGRCIYYFKPRVKHGKLSYMGWNSFTRKWERLNTYGGKLVENATQATARDILVHGMKLAEEKGFKIIGSVHDEILTSQRTYKRHNHEYLIKCMTALPTWAPGLPLKAAGYTEKRFKK